MLLGFHIEVSPGARDDDKADSAVLATDAAEVGGNATKLGEDDEEILESACADRGEGLQCRLECGYRCCNKTCEECSGQCTETVAKVELLGETVVHASNDDKFNLKSVVQKVETAVKEVESHGVANMHGKESEVHELIHPPTQEGSGVPLQVDLAVERQTAPAACKSFTFLKEKTNNDKMSFCGKTPWINEMQAVDPSANKVFVDVGCNTGSDAVDWFRLWEEGMSGVTDKWNSEVLKETSGQGACGQNKVNNEAAAKLFKSPSESLARVLCVEAMPHNAALLRKVSSEVFGSSFSAFDVIPAAASDAIGTAQFPDLPTGQETAGIHLRAGKTAEVNVTTVDTLLQDRNLSAVDILTIDTEGNDPAVLRGAKNALQKTRFLRFEVHEDLTDTAWSKTSMLSVLLDLSQIDFDCYWPGNDGSLAKLTGCWSQAEQDSYHPIGWSNVVCVKRKDKWHTILEKHAR